MYEPINDNVNVTASNTSNDLRPLRTSDIEDAVNNVYPTAWAAKSYGEITKQQNVNPNNYWGNDNNDNRTPDYDNDNDDDN